MPGKPAMPTIAPSQMSAAWNPSFVSHWRRVSRMNASVASGVWSAAHGIQCASWVPFASMSRWSSSASASFRSLSSDPSDTASRSRTGRRGPFGSPSHQCLDRVGEVHRRDVVVPSLGPDPVRLRQDLGVRVAVRRLEAIRGQFDQEPERVLEVDRVHEPAVLDAAVLDAAFVEALYRLLEGGLREREGHVVYGAGIGGGATRIHLPFLVGEDRDEAPVARIEVEVALGLVVEIRLLEDEGHPEHSLPEVDRRLPVGSGERDVVDTLALQLPHGGWVGIGHLCSTSLDLYSLR